MLRSAVLLLVCTITPCIDAMSSTSGPKRRFQLEQAHLGRRAFLLATPLLVPLPAMATITDEEAASVVSD